MSAADTTFKLFENCTEFDTRLPRIGMRLVGVSSSLTTVANIWESESVGYFHHSFWTVGETSEVYTKRPIARKYVEWSLKCGGGYSHTDFSWKVEPFVHVPKPPEDKRRRPVGPFVYFIQPRDGGLIKIGWAFNPEKRLHELMVGCPVDLAILATIPGDVRTESSLHRLFAGLRIRGEWFHPGTNLIAFIKKSIETQKQTASEE